MKKIFFLLAVLITIKLNISYSWANPPATLLVVPFENSGQQRKTRKQPQHYLSIALPLVLAENLEKSTSLSVANGRIPTITPEQFLLISEDGKVNLDEAAKLAREKGATYIVTGHFSGYEWDWTVTVQVYSVSKNNYDLAGIGSAHGDQTIEFITKSGRKARIVGAEKLFGIFAEAVSTAFEFANLPLSAEEKIAIAIPPSKDTYANILLSRAYLKYFSVGKEKKPNKNKSKETPLAIAEHAVRVDPSSGSAQRFYAFLLEENEKPKKARPHYEFAIKIDPADARSLLRLGGIEMAEKNYSAAEADLLEAIKINSKDALVFYHLGLAQLALGENEKAIASLVVSRDLAPAVIETRRRLAELYAVKKDYKPAATEFKFIVDGLPADKDAAFLLGACLRANHDYDDATLAYLQAARRFPNDNRFLKFRGDVFLKKGDINQAVASYIEALVVYPQDKRLLSLGLDATKNNVVGAPYIGGEKLVKTILDISNDNVSAEKLRSQYQDTANDAIISFATVKKNVCDSMGIASYMLAQTLQKQYTTLDKSLDEKTNSTALAQKEGEWVYLTPDETLIAGRNLADQNIRHRDWSEIVAQEKTALIPLLKKSGCGEMIEMMTARYEEVVFRNWNRIVELTEVNPPRYMMAITPQIPPVTGRIVSCFVDNTLSQKDYVLTIDGQEARDIPAGKKRQFIARVGRQRICLLPKGKTCGQEDERDVFIYEKWTATIKP